MPSIITQAKTFLTGLWRWARAGFPTSSDISKQRMDICRKCYFYNKPSGRCNHCGCYLELKTKMLNQKCPIDKW
jgi:hypothetical protein